MFVAAEIEIVADEGVVDFDAQSAGACRQLGGDFSADHCGRVTAKAIQPRLAHSSCKAVSIFDVERQFRLPERRFLRVFGRDRGFHRSGRSRRRSELADLVHPILPPHFFGDLFFTEPRLVDVRMGVENFRGHPVFQMLLPETTIDVDCIARRSKAGWDSLRKALCRYRHGLTKKDQC